MSKPKLRGVLGVAKPKLRGSWDGILEAQAGRKTESQASFGVDLGSSGGPGGLWGGLGRSGGSGEGPGEIFKKSIF